MHGLPGLRTKPCTIQMKKSRFPILLALLLSAQAAFAQSSAVIRTYVMQFKDIAIEEMKRTGVPASIKLAQGIHETMAGQSVLVRKSNNHFGIKCKETWTGQSVKHDDDAPQECFRKYDDPTQSYRDHSEFLRTRKHYASLFELDPTDYRGWALGLKKAGYATNPKYPQIIIKLIEDYNLQDYSLIALGQKTEGPDVLWAQQGTIVPQQPVVIPAVAKVEVTQPVAAPKPQYPSGVFRINDTKVIWVAAGTSYLSIAEDHHIPLARLFDFNDMPVQETATSDGLVYLQRKRKWGSAAAHKVALGENLHYIAQAEGIRLESLLALNHLEGGMQPEIGELLFLQEKAPAMPRLITATAQVSLPQMPSLGSGPAATPVVNEEGEAFSEHVVQPKETLYAIARRYSVSVQDLMKWNELQEGNLKSGQLLRIKK